MAKDNVDWDEEEQEGLIEQYVKLMPYILRDFIHKDDVKNMIIEILANPASLVGDILSDSEGIRAAREYKVILDSGEELLPQIKPVIKL